MANITTGDFQTFLDGAAKKLDTNLKNANKIAIWPQIVTKKSTKNQKERDVDMEPMGPAQFWVEDSPRADLTTYEGWPQSYTQFQWSAAVDITKPMRKFSKYELVSRLYRELKNACVHTKEIIATAYYEDGGTALASITTCGGVPLINSVGGDGVVLFSASHVWRSGSATWSNLSSSSLSLSETNLNTVYIAVRRWKTTQGMPMDIDIVKLMIPPDLEKDAYKTLESRLEPATANNAVNFAPKLMKGSYMVNPWLSNTGDWYCMTDAQDSGVNFYFGWEDEMQTGQVNPRTSNEYTSIDFSLAHGANNMRKCYKVA